MIKTDKEVALAKLFDKFYSENWKPDTRNLVHKLNEFTRFLEDVAPSNLTMLYQSAKIAEIRNLLNKMIKDLNKIEDNIKI